MPCKICHININRRRPRRYATTGSPTIADLIVVVATAKLVEKRHNYYMCTFPKEL